MKILLITEKYPPVVGGGESHLHQLAEGLAERGHEVIVVTEAVVRDEAWSKYRNGRVTVREIHGLIAACQRLEFADALQQLHQVLSDTRVDIIHVFNYLPGLLISLLRPALRAPLVVSLFETLVPGVRVFNVWADWPLERTFQHGLARTLKPDLHICGSHAYLRWLRDGGFTEPATVVEFGTDLEVFDLPGSIRDQWRAKRGVGSDELLFFVPARPVPRKRIEDAITALSLVRDRLPGARLVLTEPSGRSNGAYVDFLRAHADGCGVSGLVRWIPDLTWQDMPALYAGTDCVILPSSHEGWGIALTEGMASRRPVITTNVEGHDEVVIDGRTGWLYEAGDVDGLARAMESIGTTDPSPVVNNAYEEARTRFSAAAVVDGHIEAYRQISQREAANAGTGG